MAGLPRLTVRAITEEEVLEIGWEVNTPHRWVIVDADAPNNGLFLVGGLVLAGSDHLIVAVDEVKRMVARRKGPHYRSGLPEELTVLADSIHVAYRTIVEAGDHSVNPRIDTLEEPREVLRDVVVTLLPQIEREWI